MEDVLRIWEDERVMGQGWPDHNTVAGNDAWGEGNAGPSFRGQLSENLLSMMLYDRMA